MTEDMNGRVAGYRGLVESSAHKLAATRRAIRAGVEYDDLVQEGLLAVWQSLGKGRPPNAEHVEGRMRNWIKHLAAQAGLSQGAQHFDYEDLLPLDDLRVLQAQE
jgi:hypothetical protein